jgi:uncharacterized protein (TIGR03067 family)
MRALAVLFVSGVLLSTSPAGEQRGDASDAEKLQGAWRGRSIEVKGMPLMPSSAYNMVLRFEKDTFAVEQEGKMTVRGTFVLDPARKPKTIDLTVTDTLQTVNKGALVLGIYEVEKDRLRLCTTKANGQDRPKRFGTKPGTPHTLFVFEREKAKTTAAPSKKK